MPNQNLKNKLKGLSLEQKQELLRSLKQKEILKKEGILESFKPHSDSQRRFFESKARIVGAFCGNGWGKTTAMTLKLIYAHNPGRNPYGDTEDVRHSWLVIPGLDKAEDYWQEIKRWCPPSLLPKPNKLGTSNIRRFEWPNGSYTTLYSHDQDSGKLEGTNIDALFCDEPLPRALWIAAFRGLRNNPNYFVVFAGTLVSEPWIYEEIYTKGLDGTDKNIEVILGSTHDNPHLSRQFIADFESRLTEDEKRTRLHGEPAALQGRVFKEFSRKTHVFSYCPWPSDWPVYCAIDPHSRKPHSVLYVGVTRDEELVVIDELTIDGDIDTLCKAMKEKETSNSYKIVCRVADSSLKNSDYNRTDYLSQFDQWSRLNKYQIRIRTVGKREKSVGPSIHEIKLRLKNNTLRFLENVRETIKDMEMYSWMENHNTAASGVNEKPRKIYDDKIDPLRYIVACKPVHSASMEILSTLADKSPYNKDFKPSLPNRDDII